MSCSDFPAADLLRCIGSLFHVSGRKDINLHSLCDKLCVNEDRPCFDMKPGQKKNSSDVANPEIVKTAN